MSATDNPITPDTAANAVGVHCRVLPIESLKRAFADGQPIQWRRRAPLKSLPCLGMEWSDCVPHAPKWHSSHEYRIKPKQAAQGAVVAVRIGQIIDGMIAEGKAWRCLCGMINDSLCNPKKCEGCGKQRENPVLNKPHLPNA